ncbi:MAG: hypothetical protein KF761_12710 [Salinibacterium sp.]|nr:hypothetical protein [Salinibacterium sp.]
MSAPHIMVPRVILGFAVGAAVVDTVLYAIALSSLAAGPNIFGYEILLYANKAAGIAAVLGVAVIAARTLLGGRILVPCVTLLIASAVAGGIALGLFLLGNTLASVAPDLQPAALNSLLLALQGTGQDLAVVPVFLAVGAAVLPLVAHLRDSRVMPALSRL